MKSQELDDRSKESQIEKENQENEYYRKKGTLKGSNFLSVLFFTWISPIITFGNKHFITQKAIPNLQQCDYSEKQYNRLMHILYTIKKSKSEGFTLFRAIAIAYKKTLITLGIFAIILLSGTMYLPNLTQTIIKYVEDKDGKSLQKGLAFSVAVLLLTFIITLTENTLYYNFDLFGFNLANTVSLTIFAKATKYPILCDKQYSVSQIINRSQTDAQRFTYIGYNMASLIFTPVQILVGIWLMYTFIGISFLSGIGFMVLTMIITLVLSRIASTGNDKLLKAKDERLKTTQQIFNIIKFIKLNALEKYFFKKLNLKRLNELKFMKKVNLVFVISILVYWIATPLVLSATFATYMWLGNIMNATEAFTTIILFRILQYPIRVFPTAISTAIQIWASMKRLEKFLFTVQIDKSLIQIQEFQREDCKYALSIKNGNYMWNLQKKDKEKEDKEKEEKEKEKKQYVQPIENNIQQSLLSESYIQNKKPQFITALKDIDLQIQKGKFVMVLGDIGSGKSSLFYALLNQMKSSQGSKIHINGSIAFVPQKPWIMSSTVKENITFTLPFDEQQFNKAITLSQLNQDIKLMEKGLQTQIGQKGVTLSGGQKARIGLCRALYTNRDIYLLDDLISAVDVHVGKFIIEQSLLKGLKGKTIILVTHAVSFAQYADQIILMKNGRIIKRGTYQQIKDSQEYRILFETENNKMNEDNKQSEKDLKRKNPDQFKIQQTNLRNKVQNENSDKKLADEKDNTNKLIQQLMLPEDHKKGDINMRVYLQYFKVNGGFIFVLSVVSAMAIWQTLSTLSNIQMEYWCQDPQGSTSHLYIYLSLAISSAFFAFLRAFILVMAGIRQGGIVHKKAIKSLLYASLPKFYNRVPIGRLINRLTKDLGVLDSQIGYAVGNILVNSFSLLGNLVICIYASTPWIIIPIFVVLVICYRIKVYYMKTQREVVRLESITSSPIVTGFMSSINGIPTIRAFNLQRKFLQQQFKKVDLNKRVRIVHEATDRWFSLRLSFISFAINIAALLYCLLSTHENSSLAGLLLTYTLTLNDDVISTLFSLAYLQGLMVSFERIIHFMDIQPEKGYEEYCKKWWTKDQGYNLKTISEGSIQFVQFSVKYPNSSNLVLKDINVQIKAGEKVGIVGRTGAGKSTITNCILRILDPEKGQITIDGKDLRDYNLKDLRSCITMIQQDPTLIEGSIKENLDPLGLYTQQELQNFINQCNLRDLVDKRGGINSKISNDNLSVGEKQLICICRSFFRKSKIVLIDEATANIDLKNDKMIQQIIQDKFKGSTVLTIAHRLSTLSNSDKIMVLGEGKLLQWGEPSELLQKPNGIYKQMFQKNQEDYLL